MFDGSHRSRRTIDLGGARGSRTRGRAAAAAPGRAGAPTAPSSSFLRTSTVTGVQDHKNEVLKTTQRLREERRLQQRRQNCARDIQACYRGYRTRKCVAASLSSNSGSSNASLVLSMRLSQPLQSFLTAEAKLQALLEYEQNLVASLGGTTAAQKQLSSVAASRIVLTALGKLVPPVQETTDQLFRLTAFLFESGLCRSNDTVLMSLVRFCQDWLWQGIQPPSALVVSLWKWSCEVAASLQSTESVALLGSILFCTAASDADALWQEHGPHTYFGVSDGEAWARDVLLTSLVDSLLAYSTGNELVRMVKQHVSGREGILISNALKFCQRQSVPPPSLLKLLHCLLKQRPDLAVVTSLVVQGEPVREIIFPSEASASSSAAAMNAGISEFDGDESDSESEEDSRVHPSIPPPASRSTSRRQKSSRYSRQELQTVPKLDRIQREHLSRCRKERLADVIASPDHVHKESLVALARQIGEPAQWKEWGLSVLAHAAPEPAAAYLTVLGMLLRSSSGLRITRSTSPFVSQLAFSKPFLEGLWRRVLVLVVNGEQQESQECNMSLVATTLFSDLFSHHLMAISDDEFLQQYTTANGSQIILAEHVIVHLRSMLHDLYWTRPVLASEFDVDPASANGEAQTKALRARLMLSGTKLWNSLYERWCRLVRQAPFCDESTWWFPPLVSGGEPVLTVRDRVTHEDEESVVSMDTSDDEPHGGDAVSAAEQESDALAESFRDPKMARILTCIPQVLPFDRRVKMFHSLLSADKLKTQDETQAFREAIMRMAAQGRDVDDDMDMSGRERVQIRRGALYEDSMSGLNGLGRRLKKKVQVTFINQHGAEEAGIDGGGVFKEFLDDLIKEAFDPSDHESGAPQLFSITPSQMLAVDMATSQSPDILEHYEFLGRVLGKAVYESILVEPQFCLPFLNQLLGKQNSLEDLKNLDAEYYKNLTKLRTLSDAEINGLGLTFELTLGSGNRTRTIELLPGGTSIPVTKDNVILYVHQVAHQRLNVQGARPTRAFLHGFRDLIPASWVRLFSAYELQKLISGDDTIRGIDVASLKASMQYAAGYHPSQPYVQWFWEVLEELTAEQQKKFLRFMTSCSRQPLLGFHALEPAPCIQQIRLPDAAFLSEDVSKNVPLPTSATCMNLLKLPNYRSKELLRTKLIVAIESGAGFELT